MQTKPFRIEEFVKDHSLELNSIYGSVSNIRTKDYFDDVQKELQQYKDTYDGYQKYKDIHQKVSSTMIDPAFLDYIDKSPEPLDQNKVSALAFQNAGLTAEDMNYYNQNGDKFKNIDGLNQKLADFIYSKQPGLVSQGALGSTLSDNFTKRAGNFQLTPLKGVNTAPKTIEKDGFLITYDDNTGRIIRKTQIKTANMNDPKNNPEHPDNWQPFKDDSGNWYPGIKVKDPTTGEYTIKKMGDYNPAEIEQILADISKRDKTGVNAPPKRTGPHRSGPGKKFNALDLSTDKLKALKPGDIDKLDTGDLQQLQKLEDLIDPNTYQYLEKKLSGEDVTGVDDIKDYNDYYDRLVKFQNKMEQEDYAYPDASGKKVPKYDIPQEDWIREMEEEGLLDTQTPGQEKALANWTKKKLGI
ncbi:hypothetical protein BH10BAC5_BH10BAC5_16910 [soil metagenome]